MLFHFWLSLQSCYIPFVRGRIYQCLLQRRDHRKVADHGWCLFKLKLVQSSAFELVKENSALRDRLDKFHNAALIAQFARSLKERDSSFCKKIEALTGLIFSRLLFYLLSRTGCRSPASYTAKLGMRWANFHGVNGRNRTHAKPPILLGTIRCVGVWGACCHCALKALAALFLVIWGSEYGFGVSLLSYEATCGTARRAVDQAADVTVTFGD